MLDLPEISETHVLFMLSGGRLNSKDTTLDSEVPVSNHSNRSRLIVAVDHRRCLVLSKTEFQF